MAQKSISQLDTEATAHISDLFEVAIENASSASGYSSKKMSAEVIAEGMLNTYTYPTAMPNMQNRTVTGAINTLLGNFAPVYDETLTYSEGDTVTFNGVLFKALQDIEEPEEFDSTHWEVTTAVSEGGSGGGGGITYSTTPQKTGDIWIDGKDIWMVVVDGTVASGGETQYIFDTDVSDVVDVRLLSGVNGSIYRTLQPPYKGNNMGDSSLYGYVLDLPDGDSTTRGDAVIRLTRGSNTGSKSSVRAIIYYTKI